MKNWLARGTALLALAASAQAPASANSFSGPYIGMGAYFGSSMTDIRGERVGFAPVETAWRQYGLSGSGFVGYDWAAAHNVIVGINAELATGKVTQDLLDGDFSSGLGLIGTVRARVGYLLQPRTMMYVTGGLAYMKNDLSGRYGGFEYKLDDIVPGWTAGAGVEHRFSWGNRPMRVGGEFSYIDFETRHIEVPLRHATLNSAGWTLGMRMAFELNRGNVVSSQPMK